MKQSSIQEAFIRQGGSFKSCQAPESKKLPEVKNRITEPTSPEDNSEVEIKSKRAKRDSPNPTTEKTKALQEVSDAEGNFRIYV